MSQERTASQELLSNVTPPLRRERFVWSVGTRRINAESWLSNPPDRDSILAEKARLHDTELAAVVVSLAGQEDCADELRDLIVSALKSQGLASDIPPGPSIEVLGRMTVEDFAIMRKTGGTWRMGAASICFPSRWNLASKLGQDLSGIHGPVPGYEERLATAVVATFDRLEVGEVLERCNWTLLDTDVRHLPQPAGGDSGALAWLRIERQTLRRLSKSDSIAFGIDTVIKPLGELSESDQQALTEAVARAPAKIREYKGWPSS